MLRPYQICFFIIENNQSHLKSQSLMLLACYFCTVSETKQWKNITCKGVPPSPRDKLSCVAMGTKIIFFGGFGPLENLETEKSEQEEAEFGWFNDLFSFDTGRDFRNQIIGIDCFNLKNTLILTLQL